MYAAPREFYYFKGAVWLFKKLVAFFAYGPESYLRADFGRWHFVGKQGLWVIALQATLMLALGVFLVAPYQITMSVLRFNPTLDEVRKAVEVASPDSIDMRSRAAATLESMKDVYLLDESLSWGSYYGQLAYRLAIEICTMPFVAFVVGFVGFAVWHQLQSGQNGRGNDFPGVSHLESLGLSRDLVQGVAEPILVIAFALCVCWGSIPGSALAIPSVNADRTLGTYLLFSGVCLAAKEGMRLSGERVKRQRREGREREWGAEGAAASAGEFQLVSLAVGLCDGPVTLVGAYGALPEAVYAALNGLPEPLAEAVWEARLRASGRDRESSLGGSEKRLRTRCEACGQEYVLPVSVPASKHLRCPCGHRWRLRRAVVPVAACATSD